MKRYLVVAVVALLMGAVGGAAATVGVLVMAHNVGSYYFTDCSSTSPHDQDIGYATEYGVVSGVSPGIYGPTASVSREQMTSFIMRSSASDPMTATLLVDYVYFGGALFGQAAYDAGDITYDEYMLFYDSYNWYMGLATYESSRSKAAAAGKGPALEAMLQVMQRRLARQQK